MHILDLERHTGLERATIRFYEREGLITPERQENGYRTYSESDRDTLLKIKLLRQLGLSLEKIKDLQQGRVDFSAALTEQIGSLEQQIQSLTRARTVCIELRDSGVSYGELNAAYYLEILSRPVPNGPSWTPKVVPEFHERERAPRYSFRRFAARMLDYLLLVCILNLLIFVVFRFRGGKFGTTVVEYLISYGSWFLLVPLQACLLHKLGTTPGKWVMGLQVESCDGGYLSMERAMAREWEVLRYGVGFGLPVWSYWRMYKSWKQYSEYGKLDWDFECEYICDNWQRKQIVTGVILVCLWLLGSAITVQDRLKPKYRGSDLTVAQFAANFNYYIDMTREQTQSYDHLDREGNWYPVPGNVAIVDVGGTPEIENCNFRYTTDEDGNLETVTYNNAWTDVMLSSPLSGACEDAVMSLLTAQEGVGYKEIMAFAAVWDEASRKTQNRVTYDNLEVTWSIEITNCEYIESLDCYMGDNDMGPSRIALIFEIRILN